MAAVLPLLFVERGSQMTFVLQSLLLLVSGVYYRVDVLPGWMQVALAASRRPPTSSTACAARSIDGASVTVLLATSGRWSSWASCLIPLGLWVFARAERYAKRTGRLKRVG